MASRTIETPDIEEFKDKSENENMKKRKKVFKKRANGRNFQGKILILNFSCPHAMTYKLTTLLKKMMKRTFRALTLHPTWFIQT